MDDPTARLLGAAFVAWLSLAQPGSGGWAAELPDLEVVATTSLKLPKELAKAYVKTLRDAATGCLNSLNVYGAEVSDDEAPPSPKEGAAQYRLVVAHAGEAWVGSSLRRRSVDLARVENLTRAVARQWSWFIDIHERDAVTFSLLRWQGDGYRKLDEWSTPRRESLSWVEAATERTDLRDRPSASPAQLARARSQAIMAFKPPEGIGDALMGHLVPTMVVGLGAPERGEDLPLVTLMVTNRSPWPLEQVHAQVRCQSTREQQQKGHDAQILVLDVTFPDLLQQGQKMKVSVRAKERLTPGLRPSEKIVAPKVVSLDARFRTSAN